MLIVLSVGGVLGSGIGVISVSRRSAVERLGGLLNCTS